MYIDPISVFLSSPMDVQAERDRAKAACLELQSEPSIRQRFRLDTYAFEDWVPPLIGEQPQQTVNRYMLRPDDADVLVCILGSRLGSPFVDDTGRSWASGTAYEFETALQRYRRTGQRPWCCCIDAFATRLPEPPPKPSRSWKVSSAASKRKEVVCKGFSIIAGSGPSKSLSLS